MPVDWSRYPKDWKRIREAILTRSGGQSGVAALMASGQQEDVTPKHLRVGVNSALVNHHAIATLLIEKGIITHEEYFEALAKSAEAERKRYEAAVRNKLGKEVTLL